MKKTLKKISTVSLHLLLLLTIASCKKFLEIDRPINQLTTGAVFSDSASIESAVNGFYMANIVDNSSRLLNGRMTLATSLAADDLYAAISGSTPNVFATNSILSNNSENSACWTEAYKSIYHANIILENLQETKIISLGLKAKLSAEMKAMRALNYFYLTNLYGPVPLVLSTAYNTNRLAVRVSPDAVYKQIVTDLVEAQNVFNTSSVPLNKLRINKWAVAALLSRIYLYKKDYNNAIDQASAVINSGQFSLPVLNAAFGPTSTEVLFQIMPAITGPYNAGEGFYFVPPSTTAVPSYAMRTELLSSFESGDRRRTAWVGSNTVNNVTYYYPAKYKVRQLSPNTLKTEYDVIFRLAELYLIRAEAYAQNGRSDLSLKDLDIVRARAGLPHLSSTNPGLTGSDLLEAIYHERQTELFAEWGHRWFDLKRTNRADNILMPIKGANWQSTDKLFPIPESELNANSNLIQNEGY